MLPSLLKSNGLTYQQPHEGAGCTPGTCRWTPSAAAAPASPPGSGDWTPRQAYISNGQPSFGFGSGSRQCGKCFFPKQKSTYLLAFFPRLNASPLILSKVTTVIKVNLVLFWRIPRFGFAFQILGWIRIRNNNCHLFVPVAKLSLFIKVPEPEPQGAGTFGRSRSWNIEVSAPAPGSGSA